jgi:hypothetical protein
MGATAKSATKFRATVELGGKTATGIRVPAGAVDALGSGKRPRVYVTVGGHTYRSTVAVMGGDFFVPLSAENRAAAGVAAGDVVDVRLELDTDAREVTVPADFARALKADKGAARRFDALSYSHKRRWVLSIEEAKKAETRVRRIEKAVQMLRAEAER